MTPKIDCGRSANNEKRNVYVPFEAHDHYPSHVVIAAHMSSEVDHVVVTIVTIGCFAARECYHGYHWLLCDTQ